MSILSNKMKRSDLFHEIKSKQPYNISLMGINLVIEKDVFPPDVGATTLHLAKVISSYKNINTALDMGCGSGFLALLMRKCGIHTVWATDIHAPAINCTLENIKLNEQFSPIHTVKSDLFSEIPNHIQFDLIVFNHPYYPTIGEPVFGYNPDGGKEILTRFFKTLTDRCHIQSKIILPFSGMSESEHNPEQIASQFEQLNIRTLLNAHDENGFHKIYEITLNKENPR